MNTTVPWTGLLEKAVSGTGHRQQEVWKQQSLAAAAAAAARGFFFFVSVFVGC